MVVVEKVKKRQITLYFQRGRVCQINFGPLAGKICVIIDFVDQARALVDGPFSMTGVHRQTMPYRRLSLTGILLDIPRSPLSKKLEYMCKDQGMMKLWSQHPWRKREIRIANKESLTDFDRYKVSRLKIQRHAMVKERLKIVARNHKWRKKTLKLFRRPQSESKRPSRGHRNSMKAKGIWPPKAGEDERWPEGYARKMTDEHRAAIAKWREDKKDKLKNIRKFRYFKSKTLKAMKHKKQAVRKIKELADKKKKQKARKLKIGASRQKKLLAAHAAAKKAKTSKHENFMKRMKGRVKAEK